MKKDEAQALTPVAGVGSVWNVEALLINSQLSCTDPSAFFGLTQNATKGSKGVFLKGDAFFFFLSKLSIPFFWHRWDELLQRPSPPLCNQL